MEKAFEKGRQLGGSGRAIREAVKEITTNMKTIKELDNNVFVQGTIACDFYKQALKDVMGFIKIIMLKSVMVLNSLFVINVR